MVGDFLTDENIQAILSSINKEEPEKTDDSKGKKVQTYDFKRALRYSQDQIRTLTRIHENYARLLTSYFSTQLRAFVHISVNSVEQFSYGEFISSVQKRSILGVFKAPPLEGNMIMEYSPDVIYVMLDRLLGGQGKRLPKSNDLTEIETSVIERVILKSLTSFREAWSSVVSMSPELNELEVNPQFLMMWPPNETVILVNMNMRIGDVEGTINICLPHVVLEQVLPKLSARHWLANQKKTAESHEVQALEKKLQGTKLDVRAILGKATIEIGDFLSLTKGDIIRLDESYDDPVTILVDDKRKFYAQPGIAKGRIAVQVTDVYRGEDDFDDN